MKHIKFSKRNEWLREYVESAHGLVNLDKLKSVTTFTVPTSKIKKTEACLTRYDSKNFKMTLTLYDHIRVRRTNGKIKVEHKRHNFNYVLDSLAHELAHLKFFDHRPEHLALQARILVRMTKIASKNGILDITMPWRNK